MQKNSRPFDKIVILFNPNSTGDGKSNAKTLQRKLVRAGVKHVELKATDFAGHAEEIAREYSETKKTVLIVSASGDGGYNEVINGVLSVPGAKTVTHVLPSGNANDHHHATTKNDAFERIIAGNISTIEAIKITSTVGSTKWVRYAHSYAGIGLTAYIGKKLTEAKLNAFNEKLIVIKYLLSFRHATIRVNGTKRRYSSLVFATIHRMSKIIKLSGKNSLKDGKVEYYEMRERSLLKILWKLLIATTAGFQPSGAVKKYTFKTTRPLDIQLDGEVFRLDASSDVIVECVPQALRIIR